MKEEKASTRNLKRILLVGIFLLTNAISAILVLRTSPLIVSLGPLKRLFIGSSQIMLPLSNFFYLFLVIKLGEYWSKEKFYRSLYVATFVTAIVVLGISIYFSSLEAANYPNYVFSQFNIYLPSLRIYSSLQILYISVGILSLIYFHLPRGGELDIRNPSFKKIAWYLSIILVAVILFNSLSDFTNFIVNEITLYKKYVFASPTARNELPDLGDYYFKIIFIRDNTEENAVILHPKQSEAFPDIGNQPLIRYTLFPRRLVTQDLEEKFFKENENIDTPIYYILARGEGERSDTIFPNHSVKAVSVTILYNNGSSNTIRNIDYTPAFLKNLENFKIGVLKLK